LDPNALARLKRFAGKSILMLTHYGRKSGKPYEVKIWFVVDGDKLFIGTADLRHQWVKNMQKNLRIKLSVGGEKFEAEARFLVANNSGDDPGDQLTSHLQNLEQDQNSLLDGFNSDQAALAAQIKDLKKKTSQLAEWSQQLKTELANKNSHPKKLQETVRKIDKLTKQIQKEQRVVATALGIEA